MLYTIRNLPKRWSPVDNILSRDDDVSPGDSLSSHAAEGAVMLRKEQFLYLFDLFLKAKLNYTYIPASWMFYNPMWHYIKYW